MGLARVLAAVLLALALPAVAQQPLPDAPSASDWHKVELVAPGRTVQLRGANGEQNCLVQRVSADSIACAGGSNSTYARADVRSVRVHHRWRSALVGGAVGFGVGAIVGAASGGSGCKSNSFCLNFVSRGDWAAIVGVAGGVVGLPVGYFTDFTRATVYKSR